MLGRVGLSPSPVKGLPWLMTRAVLPARSSTPGLTADSVGNTSANRLSTFIHNDVNDIHTSLFSYFNNQLCTIITLIMIILLIMIVMVILIDILNTPNLLTFGSRKNFLPARMAAVATELTSRWLKDMVWL